MCIALAAEFADLKYVVVVICFSTSEVQNIAFFTRLNLYICTLSLLNTLLQLFLDFNFLHASAIPYMFTFGFYN